MSAAKLETQNGIRNRRYVCQGFVELGDARSTLSSSATPMTALIPRELSQIAGDGSKWAVTVTRYQMR